MAMFNSYVKLPEGIEFTQSLGSWRIDDKKQQQGQQGMQHLSTATATAQAASGMACLDGPSCASNPIVLAPCPQDSGSPAELERWC